MRRLFLLGWLAFGGAWLPVPGRGEDSREFFEARIRPVLIEHCYRCHSAEAEELQGELRLDLRQGWELGGESGKPAVVPGRPEESPLIQSIRHQGSASPMPPDRPQLAPQVLADLTEWVARGAFDPRTGDVTRPDRAADWEAEYRARLDWWSLRPLSPPVVELPRPSLESAAEGTGAAEWGTNEVDSLVLARLTATGLSPAPEADRRALARRLSFALTGLPPDPARVERFVADPDPEAWDRLVSEWIDSPHFGERWARHWMDVVHYADTHGYEWDVPAKNAWRYRDYLIRAWNADVSYRQLILEHLAGDLIEARIDPVSGVRESWIAPMFWRLGERRHGDNAFADGVTQEAIANAIDTLGKGFLGTTLACAQCHNHKLDAVEQRDYYSLAGIFMSSRFSARTVDAVDPNEAVLAQLQRLKQQLRSELARQWLAATHPVEGSATLQKIRELPRDEKPSPTFPATLADFWKRTGNEPITAEIFQQERERRIAHNRQHLQLLADFTSEAGSAGWRWDGFGMKHGLVRDGEWVVADEGDTVVLQVLPAGRFTHAWSQRLAGSLQSPELDSTSPVTLSIELAAGKGAAESLIIDRALHSERLQFFKTRPLGWLSMTSGNFSTLEGTPDRTSRRVYWEVATKALNNYFPPRVGYGGVAESEVQDPRSWFGVTRVYRHPPGQGPQDELARFAPLFTAEASSLDWAPRLVQLLHAAVDRWAAGTCDREDALLLNEAVQLGWLPNRRTSSGELERLVAEYRAAERQLQPDRTAGSLADWHEGRDERLGLRGSYTELGEPVPRGVPRFLQSSTTRASSSASGRLELAQRIADERNPLTARVFVNRVWLYLFGAGLVRTPDDFGHLGEAPTHPELLDYLADRFMREGWSPKKLIRLLVTSSTWRQSSVPSAAAVAVDPENRLWHHYPLRRLEAEAIRDAMLVVSGRWDSTLYGPPIEPHRSAEDSQKRLLRGPLDGDGRRSVYLEMTLMEPPRFLALFNQPIPKQTVGLRDVTNVPDQALALLNDPLVTAMAKHWSERLLADGSRSPEQRAGQMLQSALGRPPSSAETERLTALVRKSAALRGIAGESLLDCQLAWQDAAHAIFNLQEFLHVP